MAHCDKHGYGLAIRLAVAPPGPRVGAAPDRFNCQARQHKLLEYLYHTRYRSQSHDERRHDPCSVVLSHRPRLSRQLSATLAIHHAPKSRNHYFHSRALCSPSLCTIPRLDQCLPGPSTATAARTRHPATSPLSLGPYIMSRLLWPSRLSSPVSLFSDMLLARLNGTTG